MGSLPELASGFPGYNARIPRENGFLSEILRSEGYNTYAVGKWHLTPLEHASAAGPYDSWPLGRGFERFYGFWGAGVSQYHPHLVYDNHQVSPPKTPANGYHLTEDLVDRAISFITDAKQVAPQKPFLLYFCPGAMHAPHHVPRGWSADYTGVFDDGWSAYRERTFSRQQEMGIVPAGARLSPHNVDVPEWESLSPEERRVCVRMMEIFAQFLEHTDSQIGRLIDHLQLLGEFENTIIIVTADNGASSEGGPFGSTNEMRFANGVSESISEVVMALDALGGPDYWNHYPRGWGWAGDTPFRRWKRETYRGGVSVPMVVHWPRGVHARNEVRDQYTHGVDLVPTLLDIAGIRQPTEILGIPQAPIEGVSFAHTFGDSVAPSRRVTQYFEQFGHRSIYHNGWKAVCPWPEPGLMSVGIVYKAMSEADLEAIDAEGWELYNVAEDFAEVENIAASHPDVLRELINHWYLEAATHRVFPLDGRGLRFLEPRPGVAEARDSYVYYPQTQMIPANAAANVLNRSHTIRADLEISRGRSEGVIVSQGGRSGGYSLFVMEDQIHYVYNYVGSSEFHLRAPLVLRPGRTRVVYEFEKSGDANFGSGRGASGRGRLFIDNDLVDEVEIPVSVPLIFELGSGLVVGSQAGSPVSQLYEAPFAFTGVIHEVRIELDGRVAPDPDGEGRAALRNQ